MTDHTDDTDFQMDGDEVLYKNEAFGSWGSGSGETGSGGSGSGNVVSFKGGSGRGSTGTGSGSGGTGSRGTGSGGTGSGGTGTGGTGSGGTGSGGTGTGGTGSGGTGSGGTGTGGTGSGGTGSGGTGSGGTGSGGTGSGGSGSGGSGSGSGSGGSGSGGSGSGSGDDPICFTPGVQIATISGKVSVEDLKVGDKIVTRDNGLQTIRWIGNEPISGRRLLNNPHLRPVLIRKGSLGRDLPERDMMVSPNHRMLVANHRTSLLFEDREVLVAAKHLIDHKGIQQIDCVGTRYIHILFDAHEVLLADGTWTESFQPGDYSLNGMGNAQRSEIFEIFPELRETHGRKKFVAARRSLRRREARLLQ